MDTPPIKCVIVGDGARGKNWMLRSFLKEDFPKGYVSSGFEDVTHHFNIDARPATVNIVKTPGQEDYDRLRPLYYLNADVIIICFSVTAPSSFINVTEKWFPEASHHCPGKPVILVGTKVDKRNNPEVIKRLKSFKEKPITFKDGTALAKKQGAQKYVECSALTGEGVASVFYEACKAAYLPKRKK